MKWLLIPLFILNATLANAVTPLSRSLVSGNALINPESIQQIVKELIVQNLKKNYQASSQTHGFTLQTEATEHSLEIPEKALLKDILNALGVENQVQVKIDPIQTEINFGADSFSIKIENVGTNLFSIRAHWEVNELNAESDALNLIVPKGIFDQAFTITSSNVKIGLKPNSGPITADLQLTANLTSEGSKITLDRFKTNLDSTESRLVLKLGALTVNGKPLEIEITSNGQSILTKEPTIRSQFQSFEPQLMKNVQKQLAVIIQKQFTQLSEKLNKQDPFKYTFKSNEFLKENPIKDPALNNLFKDISGNFVFSYIQELPRQRLFSTQISSQICIGVDCLTNNWGTTAITTSDLQSLTGEDAGILLYESWAQNMINSDAFQKRVRKYYATSLKSPGVSLGDDGIKIHFNSSKNAVIAVLNLKIDIKATTTRTDALSSWSNFWKYEKNQLADMWEYLAGSGKYVYVPVEITAKIAGMDRDKNGKKVLVLNTEIPFHKNGSITNTYKYKSNVQDMNATIRKELLSSVQKEVGKSLPSRIELPVEDGIEMDGIKFNINQVMITPNKALLVSGCLKK